MTPRDLARFAYLLPRDERWHQQQLVAKEWLRSLTATPFSENLRSNRDGYFGKHYPEDLLCVSMAQEAISLLSFPAMI
jgi:CubicO group peptidase (beta-lactamase class C family)